MLAGWISILMGFFICIPDSNLNSFNVSNDNDVDTKRKERSKKKIFALRLLQTKVCRFMFVAGWVSTSSSSGKELQQIISFFATHRKKLSNKSYLFLLDQVKIYPHNLRIKTISGRKICATRNLKKTFYISVGETSKDKRNSNRKRM